MIELVFALIACAGAALNGYIVYRVTSAVVAEKLKNLSEGVREAKRIGERAHERIDVMNARTSAST